MRLIPVMSTALAVSLSGPAFAQPPSPQASASLAGAERGGGEWIEFVSQEDRFTCNFPGQPKVTETTWTSEHGAVLPARVYSAEVGSSRYSMTVVDYRNIERILTQKSKACPAGAETCLGDPIVTGYGYWKIDKQGAPTFARWKFLQRDAKVTHSVWNQMGMVGGEMLQLTNNADKSRTFASIYMHEDQLYIMEGTVPAGYPEPGLFQQSLWLIDEKGEMVWYESFYINGLPKPRRISMEELQRRANQAQAR